MMQQVATELQDPQQEYFYATTSPRGANVAMSDEVKVGLLMK
jgi:hypothetical protein